MNCPKCQLPVDNIETTTCPSCFSPLDSVLVPDDTVGSSPENLSQENGFAGIPTTDHSAASLHVPILPIPSLPKTSAPVPGYAPPVGYDPPVGYAPPIAPVQVPHPFGSRTPPSATS